MTIILKEHDAEFPNWSVNVYTTKVTPSGKFSPGRCVASTMTGPDSSIACGGVQNNGAPVKPAGTSTTLVAGHGVMMLGGVLSIGCTPAEGYGNVADLLKILPNVQKAENIQRDCITSIFCL